MRGEGTLKGMEQLKEIVSLADYRKDKESQTHKEVEALFGDSLLDSECIASEFVMESIESSFEVGMVIGIKDNTLEVSCTSDNIDAMISLLETALDSVKNNY